MSWVKLSDDALTSPPITDLDDRDDRLLFLELLSYRNKNLTGLVDLAVPQRALRWATDHPDPAAGVERLVAAGAMTVAEGGWHLVWFVKEQLDLAEVKAAKDDAIARQQRHRHHVKDDHSLCDPKRCWALVSEAKASRNGVSQKSHVTNGPSIPSPTLPAPTRMGKGKGGESADGSRGARPEGATALPPREVRISTADTEILAGIHNGRLCSYCTLPFLEGGVQARKVEAGGRYRYLMVHDVGCPFLPESISEDGEFRRDWSLCSICGSQMPEALVTPDNDAGDRFCLDHDPRGCGGRAVEAVRLGEVTAQAVETVVPDAPPLEELAQSPVAYIAKAATRAIADRPAQPRPRTVWCSDFRAHTSAHRRLGDGWVCDLCVASAVAI